MQKRLIASGALLALSLTACSSSVTQADTIKIGFIGPLTGDAVGVGTDLLHGAELAVAEINAAGGIDGKQIQLIAEDGRCNGADAANAAQKLVNADNVVAILGGQCSSETLAAAPIAEAGETILISSYSSNPKVTDAGDFVFRDYPSDALKGKAFAGYFNKAGFKKLAMITENSDGAQGIRASVKNDLPESVELVMDETVDQGTKDFRSLLTRLKALDFDVFLPNGQSDATIVEMVKQMRELGMTQQIIGSDVADSANMGILAKDAVEGLKPLSIPLLGEDDVRGGDFVRAFKAEYGEPQYGMFFAATAYDAMGVLASVMNDGHTDGPAIRDALYALTAYEGVTGTLSFDENGDIEGIPFAMKQFKDGVLVQDELIPIE